MNQTNQDVSLVVRPAPPRGPEWEVPKLACHSLRAELEGPFILTRDWRCSEGKTWNLLSLCKWEEVRSHTPGDIESSEKPHSCVPAEKTVRSPAPRAPVCARSCSSSALAVVPASFLQGRSWVLLDHRDIGL